MKRKAGSLNRFHCARPCIEVARYPGPIFLLISTGNYQQQNAKDDADCFHDARSGLTLSDGGQEARRLQQQRDAAVRFSLVRLLQTVTAMISTAVRDSEPKEGSGTALTITLPRAT